MIIVKYFPIKEKTKMKKLLCLLAIACVMLTLVACPNPDDDSVLTHSEYLAAEEGTEVVIEAYVQGHQSWWFDSEANTGKITVYAQDKDGGYFIYEASCTEAVAERLVPGTKIRVTGSKTSWAGEIEIVDATIEIVGGDTFVATATDVTSLLGTDELVDHQNEFVSFKGLTFVSIEYKGGSRGNDIYVNLEYNGAKYQFCVESYLTGPDSDVYKAVEALKSGDTVDIEGFLYWYEGVNTHITGVTVK